MRLDWAILCNAAERAPHGLVYLLGAGVDTFYRARFPSHARCSLAIRLVAARAEEDTPHQLEIRCTDDDGEAITRPVVLRPGPFSAPLVTPDDPPADGDVTLHLVADFELLPLHRAGRYRFELHLDGRHVASLPFRAVRTS
jgi:hypothetical protein